MTTDYNKTDGPLPTTRKQTGHHLQKTQSLHNIPKGKLHSKKQKTQTRHMEGALRHSLGSQAQHTHTLWKTIHTEHHHTH